MNFAEFERQRQRVLWAESHDAEHLLPSGFQLGADFRALNILPQVRDEADAYFRTHKITWHRHANHALSSQVACINFMMPLATRPDLLATVTGRAVGTEVKMLPVEIEVEGPPSFVAFEWIGRQNYLDEWGKGLPVRGQNVTSTDAMVQFDAGNGRETLLIEWKYIESYGKPTVDWQKGNPTRVKRYGDKAFEPDGPIRAGLGLAVEDFLFEPIYQMFRQQMLAWRMQKAREDGAQRVRVMHVAPKGNLALQKVTAPVLAACGLTNYKAFASVLVDPDAFLPRSAETLFAPLLDETGHDRSTQDWIEGLGRRYAFLLDGLSEPQEKNTGV